MGKAYIRSAVVAVLLTFAPVRPSAAQSIPSPYRYIEEGQEAGAFVAWIGAGPGALGFGPDAAVAYGGRYAIQISQSLALEGQTAWMPTTRAVVNPRNAEGSRVVDEAEATLLFFDARIRLGLTGRRTWNDLHPFVVAGGGLLFDVAGDQLEDQKLQAIDRFDMGTGFTGVFGAGVRWLPGGPFAIRADAGVTLYKLDLPDGWSDTTLELDPAPGDEWISAGTLGLGIAWIF